MTTERGPDQPMRDYYAAPGPTTDLTGYEALVRELPDEPRELAGVVRGLVLHDGIVALKKMEFSAARMADRRRTGAAAILAGVLGLDASPLVKQRPMEDRMIGYCYHFALLHCAFLRAKGIPARTRCGFASYFREDTWIDHWVVEYWGDGSDGNGEGWVLIDPDAARDELAEGDFHNGGEAWLLCRKGELDAARHGNYTLWGWDELRGTLVNDIGALNKLEVGDWDWCSWLEFAGKEQPHAEVDARLDPIAPPVASALELDAVRRAFEADPGLQPPYRGAE